MRFEVIAAFAVGILLPLLETYRRGWDEWTVDFTTMFEDYVAGGLLLIGVWASAQRRRWGALFLVVAWSYLTGMMSGSFWYQLEDTLRGTVTEPPVVLVVKFLLWAVSVLALVSSFRRSLRDRSGAGATTTSR